MYFLNFLTKTWQFCKGELTLSPWLTVRVRMVCQSWPPPHPRQDTSWVVKVPGLDFFVLLCFTTDGSAEQEISETCYNIIITTSALMWAFDLIFATQMKSIGCQVLLPSICQSLTPSRRVAELSCAWVQQREQLNTMEWELKKLWIAPIMARRQGGS